MTIHLDSPKCTAKTLTKEDKVYNHRSVCIHLEFQPKIKSWMISLHSTVYLNCINVLTHNVIFPNLQNTLTNFFPNY